MPLALDRMRRADAYRRFVAGAVAAATLAPCSVLALEWGELGVDDDMLRIEVGGGWACWANTRRSHGLGGDAYVGWQPSPYFQIGGRGSLGAHTSKGEAFSLATFGPAARAQLDIVEIVPWLELAPSLYVLSGEGDDTAARPGLSTGLGIEVLLDPSWSLGMSAHYHRVTGEERFPAWMQLGATLGWRTVLGNPLAP